MSASLTLWEAERLGLDYLKYNELLGFCSRRPPPGVHWAWRDALRDILTLPPGCRSINAIRHLFSRARRSEIADQNATARWLDMVSSGTTPLRDDHLQLIIPYTFSRLLGMRAPTASLPTVWPEYDLTVDPTMDGVDETELITKKVRDIIIALLVYRPGETLKSRLSYLYGLILEFRARWPAVGWHQTWEFDYPELVVPCSCCPQ
ncbi:hypothetical protein V8C35DRAFT_278986 [Trichoderma chlorosporum]